MDIFELSEIQAQYILDTPLRRLTRYDRLELEREQETLRAEIAELTEILESDAAAARAGQRRAGRGGEEVRHPAPHRAARGGGAAADRRRPARGHRRPVRGAAVATGLLARTAVSPAGRVRSWMPNGAWFHPRGCAAGRAGRDHRGDPGHRPGHDRRGDVRGTAGQAGVLELPALPPSGHVGLAGGTPASEFAGFRARRDRGRAGVRRRRGPGGAGHR
jgi:DNA gyrase subunit A